RQHHIQPKVVENWSAFLAAQLPLALTVAPIERGILLDAPPLAVISENQLFGERVAQKRLRNRRSSQRDSDTIVRNLTELTLGAPVVHEAHGVGRYRGLVTLDVGGISAEFLHLEYARQDKLYVPVSSLHLISRFTGMDPEQAPLHRLGSGQWEKAKRKAAQQVSDIAVELLDIYARRAARQGYAFPQQTDAYRAFAQAFPFEETPDQQEAIDAVLADMYAAQPMDRLICGDVGFGKTEVAMRAAFIAVLDGQQVAVLVPTTLLAQQHYQNFQDRFAEWPVKIEQLSRFRSKKQQEQALKAIAEGQIDIVIGTHKLLQGHIQFKRLGLIIIDEEHRFGVKQKERFKALRTEVDILALTATPIPRSLNMALSHLRDLSIIATPPSRRLAVKTFIREWHTPTLIEALQRELKRGGQVYFIHNSIDDIDRIAEEIRQLLPETRVEIAHGQMRERALERVMQDFYHRRFNILVCTTIIETGIDVPNANTIIINRADKLGLAQLYQLRGRVGRSHHRAYAYLIVPPKKMMTPDALKRLDAIGALEELGMGFTLATHDLEIRGAGELLGHEQSGHMQEIGYNLYTELLERAVNALKSGKQPELSQPLPPNTDINLYSPALLPSDYLPDVHTRLIMYKRIASATDKQALYDIQVEMVDRFGLLPEPAKTLIKIAELKLKATALGIRKIEFSSEGGYLLFDTPPAIDPASIVHLIQTQPQHYRLEGQNKLRLLFTLADFSSRYQTLEQLLTQLNRHEEVVC
ncbi:MAG: transcription-repair coupling factor, partial [Pseudomonadota bacterium]|nr:transcription-repair coupling factor [Pseudomonadota bacterium]